MDRSLAFLACGRFAAALVVAVVDISSPAQTDIAGLWNGVHISTPARLTLVKANYRPFGNELVLIDRIQESGGFDAGTVAITVDSQGNFTGPATGTATLIGPGLVKVSPASDSPAFFNLNAAQDVMISVKSSDAGAWNDVEVLLKAPASLTTEQITGTWIMASFRVPNEMLLLKETKTRDPVVPVTGIYQIEGADEFDAGLGSMTITGNGTFTLHFGGEALNGSIEPGPNGRLTASIPMPPEQPLILTLNINQSKDVMAGIHSEENSHEMLVLVKLPGAQEVGSLKGLWRVGSFETPARLNLEMDREYGFVTRIQETNGFRIHNEKIHVGHDGIMTAPLDLSTGTLAVQSPGHIRVSGTNALEESWEEVLTCNAGGNLLIDVRSGGANELTLAVRAPSDEFLYPGGSVNPRGEFGEIIRRTSEGEVTIFWAPDADRELTRSSDLSTWMVVPNTMGTNKFSPDIGVPGQFFYRVRRVPP